MKKFAFLLVAVFMITSFADAKIRRVGFFGSPISGTDYSTFALAYTAATSGDTILMFPSTTLNGTITKKLTLIGPGYWLDPNTTPKGNANLQAFAGISTLNSIVFDVGSDGSVMSGFYGGNVYIKDNNITIIRNSELIININYTNPAATVTNLQVLQNYRVAINNYYTNASGSTNMNISNNLISYFATSAGNTYSGNISNNVWAYDATQSTNNLNGGSATLSGTNGIDLGSGAYLLQNNIFLSYTNAAAPSNYNYFIFSNGGNSIFNYNLGLQAATPINWGTGVGNVITPIANAANVFAAWPLIATTSADARYQLKAGSPALVANRPGSTVNAGMFAGSYPYKLSLIPTIPTIYTLSSPQGNNPPGSTIQINVSTRGNN
ncbi:MAG: hypothetical protein IPP72_07910 [Chitinophagaceae bacterium]|nr:hypothetical protein [Chitinophagaceae bacterium]